MVPADSSREGHRMTIDLAGSPYSIEGSGRGFVDKAAELQERANLLREQGRLTELTLRTHFGDKRFEWIAESDLGGDLGLIAGLILARAEDALRSLERAATAHQDYDVVQARLRKAQQRQVAIWNDAVRLLFSLVVDDLTARLGDVGQVSTHWYDDELLVDDYVALSQGDSAGNSWLFRLEAVVPGLESSRYLAWTGYRGNAMQRFEGLGAGPSIFWSVPDPSGYRKWMMDDSQSPGVVEITLSLPAADRWIAKLPNGEIRAFLPSAIARRVARAVVESMSGS